MNSLIENQHSIYAALFVDFDNVYITLSEHDNELANQFATNPDRWFAWLEKRLPHASASPDPVQRRILIRRCYLNPQAFASFRPYFVRSAFECIDCPPLTTRGKTSTDIHMVMDILDALSHETYFNEFIILSGDADFTPAWLRIRKYGRYSAVLSAGYASPAYKAACDYLISQDTFMRDALGIGYQDEDASIPIEDREISEDLELVLNRMVSRLHEVAAVPGGIEASGLPAVYREFVEFRQGNHWLGFNSLRRLTQAIISRGNDLAILEEDPWRVVVVRHARQSEMVPPPVEGQQDILVSAIHESVRAEIADWIKGTVNKSASAVPMAALAQAVSQRFREHLTDTTWLGAGTFKGLLAQLDLGNLGISSVIPGFVYDPVRHPVPSTVQENGWGQHMISGATVALDDFELRYPELAPLARKIHQLTDIPYLLPEHYALLLQELAREINERGYQMTRASKTVRDRCVEKGAPIARSHVNFVLIGIGYTGYRFGRDMPESAMRLGEALVQNTINLCRTAQLNLTDAETSWIREWILGGFPK